MADRDYSEPASSEELAFLGVAAEGMTPVVEATGILDLGEPLIGPTGPPMPDLKRDQGPKLSQSKSKKL